MYTTSNKPECYLVNVSKNSGFEFELMNDKPKKAYEHYKGIFKEPPVDDLLDPCFPIIAEAVDLLLSGTYKWYIILALSTVVMTVLVAVVLLYNSGQGELFPHLNKVRSPHRNSLVWFFIKMDGEEQNFNDEDLTDFSIIQELKDFDIDKDFTMRCLVLFAICAWIACAEDDCRPFKSVRFSLKSFEVDYAPKGHVEAVEKILAKKLPKDTSLTALGFTVKGQAYLAVIIGEIESSQDVIVFEKRNSELVGGRRLSDTETHLRKLVLCKLRCIRSMNQIGIRRRCPS
ncbi:hypothetical protein NECAME_16172 [Necator americanus]|uniref:Uncharacterized protein n=1 Tax=Necator americanus TaxID=51031 RepID=W2TYI7_NECAM|nr:hypothetical protein NECAME_16172 [Necator americanus]ETN86729.1 hypothetical protein NECAME_16172 [Necator americanus]